MHRARAVAEKCQSRDDSIDHDYWNAHAGMMLPTALDEIDRMQVEFDQCRINEASCMTEMEIARRKIRRQTKHIADLEAITNVEITDHNMCMIRSILHGDPHSKGQRIRSFNVAGNVFRRMQKQRAALKTLGQAKRARGKALAEERARTIHSEWRGNNCDYHESAECRAAWRNFCGFVGCPHKNELIALAREQLRQEGKL